MSFLCRQACCMAILGAITLALVACGAGPGATKTQDPVGFKNIELRQGFTSEISLVNTFSGSELTYSATTSDRSVATVAVNNDKDSLTATAVDPGRATITVTAKNPQGSASQTFTVTVPRPTAPDPDPVEIPDIPSLEEDATHTIRLGDKFRGTELTYTAESNRTSVATEEVDNDADTITVTAVGPGMATITVTATAQGSAPQTQTFTVTVPEPQVTPPGEPPTGSPTSSTKCPPPAGTHLKIVRDDHAECTLQAGQRLISEDPGSVSVKVPSKGGGKDVWIITAGKKGLHRVFIFKGNDKAGEILVKVPNTSPKWIRDPNTPPTLTPTVGDSTTHTTSDLPLTDFFDDVDEADHFAAAPDNPEEFKYAVSYAPEGVLIDTENEFVNVAGVTLPGTTAGTFKVVILKTPEDPFTIELHAHDGEDFSDSPVTLTFAAVTPRALTYEGITQSSTDGSLEIPAGAGDKGKLRVSNRIDRDHSIVIGGTGYIFATQWEDKLDATRRIEPDADKAANATVCTSSQLDDWKNTSPDLGTGCYSITSNTKDVEIRNAGASTPTTIMFKLPSTQRSVSETGDATITITYNVWALPSSKSGSDAVDNTVDKEGGRTDSTKRVKLYLDLDKCVKATDCP